MKSGYCVNWDRARLVRVTLWGLLMPCRYVIDKERRLVISTGWDRVTFSEIKVHQDQLLSDPDFSPEFDQLADGTAVTALDLSIDEAKEVARRKLFSPTSKRAFVGSSPAIYGMLRLAGTYHEMSKESSKVSVFHDLPSALQWLGLKDLPNTIKREAVKAKAAADPAGNEKTA